MPNEIAETYMAVRAAEAGLAAAKKKLDDQLAEWREANGVRGGLDTSFGPIDVRHKPAEIVFTDQAGLLEYVKVTAPTEIEPAHDEVTTVHVPERVRSTGWLAKRCTALNGQVFDTVTGEALPFAAVQPASDTLAARLTPEAKQSAADAILSRIDQLAAMVSRPEIEA